MELKKEHRSALLVRLDKSEKEKQSLLATMERMQQKKQVEQSVIDLLEIDVFLLTKQLEIIWQSIIDNEIDF